MKINIFTAFRRWVVFRNIKPDFRTVSLLRFFWWIRLVGFKIVLGKSSFIKGDKR